MYSNTHSFTRPTATFVITVLSINKDQVETLVLTTYLIIMLYVNSGLVYIRTNFFKDFLAYETYNRSNLVSLF